MGLPKKLLFVKNYTNTVKISNIKILNQDTYYFKRHGNPKGSDGFMMLCTSYNSCKINMTNMINSVPGAPNRKEISGFVT